MSKHDNDIPRGEPSPQEIREACAKIREGWDAGEFRVRAGMSRHADPWLPPGMVRVIESTGCQNQELADK